jgi:hypothetical protein
MFTLSVCTFSAILGNASADVEVCKAYTVMRQTSVNSGTKVKGFVILCKYYLKNACLFGTAAFAEDSRTISLAGSVI